MNIKATRLIQISALALFFGLLFGLLATPAQAQTDNDTADLPNLEQFLDDTIERQLAEMNIPGATVAVVAGDQLLLAKGYGYAQFDPDRLVGKDTLFRTGSVGKLMTWTAVMQLVEQGRLDLNTGVNEYIDFTIPATFPEPITLAHLLTHTAGFEDVGEALFVLSEDEMLPLAQYMVQLQPARVFPPGQAQAYSNYGAALAGYIVQQVSGEPFADYVENHIFAPLGMARSTLRQPIPAALADDVAAGYGTGDYRRLRGGFVYIAPYPAGSMSTPAADMAPFMIAHLQNGRYQETSLLQPETVRLMHSRQFAPDPRLDGMAYGFMLQRVNGRDVLFHRGSMFQFNAALYLLPAENVGLYVAYNGAGALEAPALLWQAFMDEYFPAEPVATLSPPLGAAERLAAYRGEYHMARAEFSGPAKFIRLLEAAQVTASRDGYLQLMVEGHTERYVEVESGFYRHETRAEYLAFHTDEEGNQWLSLDGRPAFLNFTATSAFQVPAYESLSFGVLLILLTLLLFIGSAIGWLIGWLRGRGKGVEQPFNLRPTRWLAVAFGLGFLFFLLALVSVVGDIDPAFGVPRIFFGAPPIVDTILLIPWLLAAVAVGLALSAALLWRDRLVGLWPKIHLSLLALLALTAVWWLWQWNLL
jgi:CubicO group peptidase (beta-lactamase class C family)